MSGPKIATPLQARLGEAIWKAVEQACQRPDGTVVVSPEEILEVLASVGANILLVCPEAEADRIARWFADSFPGAVRGRRALAAASPRSPFLQ